MLHKHEDLSSNPQQLCKRPSVAHIIPVTPELWKVETGGWLRLAGCQLGSRFSERPCIKGTRRTVTEPVTQCPPVASESLICTWVNTAPPHTHKRVCQCWIRTLGHAHRHQGPMHTPGSGVICGRNRHCTKKEQSTLKMGVGRVGWGVWFFLSHPTFQCQASLLRLCPMQPKLSRGHQPASSICYPQCFSPSVLPCAFPAHP